MIKAFAKFFVKLYFSFPIQLVLDHFKRNLGLIFIWVLFMLTVSGQIGKVYGVSFLFLDPEYVGKVNFWSFLMVGLAFGNFIVAFHITCYILDGHKYKFIGILERPFGKFSLNNSLIPIIALTVYIVWIIRFQIDNENTTGMDLFLMILGLVVGVFFMTFLLYAYFKFTNKDIFKFLAGSVDKRLKKTRLNREKALKKLKESKQGDQYVRSYIDLRFKVCSTNNLYGFYNKEAVLRVFDQNHFNSVVIEILIIILIFMLGIFMDNRLFQLPAAASCLLIFSIMVMLGGAISYWFRGWGITFMLGLALFVNFMMRSGVIKGDYRAAGLAYEPQVSYDLDNLNILNSPENFDRDKGQVIGVLENWKGKFEEDKPKMIFLTVSGGGQRAALWVFNGMQKADSVLNGELMNHTVLITGASGGIIGSAYFRELYRRKVVGQDINLQSEGYLENIARDNLNPIIFSLLVSDLFVRYQRFEYDGKSYRKDRGYAFEKKLNENTGFVLDRKLSDYKKSELNADIPMLLLSPTIVNDGRKLYVSPLNMSFMNSSEDTLGNGGLKIRGVDFNRLFEDQDSEDLSFLTALRMSASFPYITPRISLPSEPPVEIMDAGISDNFGISDAIRFIYVFREWIEENTSGVVFLTIRDTRKVEPIEEQRNPSLMDKVVYPIASVYNNLANIQDINNDREIEFAQGLLDIPIDLVELEYNTSTLIEDQKFASDQQKAERKEIERASLSWHLTTKEKRNIIDNIELPNNQEALKRLQEIVHQKED